MIERQCAVCGKKFFAATNQKYCSLKCRHRAYCLRRKNRLAVRKCDVCGAEFKPQSPGVKYCSARCRKLAQPEKICETCGKIFHPLPQQANSQRFCSKKCPRYTCKCVNCGKEFKDFAGDIKYCSQECRHQAQAEKICVVCGKTFKPRYESHQKFCSATCETKFHNQVMRSRRTRCDYAEKNCAVCGKIFKPKIKTQILCGDLKCKRQRADSISRKNKAKIKQWCRVCGKVFRGNRKTCSDECLQILKKQLGDWLFVRRYKNGKKGKNFS